jgi:hypothetical protein
LTYSNIPKQKRNLINKEGRFRLISAEKVRLKVGDIIVIFDIIKVTPDFVSLSPISRFYV